MRGERLREIREKRQFSQRELASRCGIGEKQIWRYEKGTSEPTSGHLTKLARELLVSADYLLGLIDNPGIQYSGEQLTDEDRQVVLLLLEARKSRPPDSPILPVIQASQLLLEMVAKYGEELQLLEEERYYMEMEADANQE